MCMLYLRRSPKLGKKEVIILTFQDDVMILNKYLVISGYDS